MRREFLWHVIKGSTWDAMAEQGTAVHAFKVTSLEENCVMFVGCVDALFVLCRCYHRIWGLR